MHKDDECGLIYKCKYVVQLQNMVLIKNFELFMSVPGRPLSFLRRLYISSVISFINVDRKMVK